MGKSEPSDNRMFVIDWLTYRSYESNRNKFPEIDPKRWNLIYYNGEKFDIIYKEQKILEKTK